jgi:hypothetical protein
MSTSLDDLGSLLEALKNPEHCGEVCRWHGEDVLAAIVEDEVSIEVARSDWRAPVPGVAAVGVLHLMLGLTNRRIVAPHVGTNLVAVESLRPLFIGLILMSVGVDGDEKDPAMLYRR